MLQLRASQKEAGAFRALSPKCQLLRDIVNQFPATGNDETALNKVVFPVLPPWLAFPHHVCENKASATALFSRSILLTDANRKMRGACKCAVTLKEQLWGTHVATLKRCCGLPLDWTTFTSFSFPSVILVAWPKLLSGPARTYWVGRELLWMGHASVS